VPVLVLAALGARVARNAIALVLAVAGVALLSDVQLSGEPLGLAFAAANAALFALYIVLAHRAARTPQMSGIDGLAGAMVVAAALVTPATGWQVAGAVGDPVALLAGVGVGICSSVIPYVTDQLAMARLSRATYALMVAMLPAAAVVVGVVVLGQLPTAAELLAIGLVIAGVAIHRDPGEREQTITPEAPDPESPPAPTRPQLPGPPAPERAPPRRRRARRPLRARP
jgi:inner membrane transporter RhtA